MKGKEMKPVKTGKVTPDPYFVISFDCSNRRFYEVKSELYHIADVAGIEIEDGYISEKCDYEGDLEKIIIYGGERGRKLRGAVLHHYGITEHVPEGMNIHIEI